MYILVIGFLVFVSGTMPQQKIVPDVMPVVHRAVGTSLCQANSRLAPRYQHFSDFITQELGI